MYWLLKINKDIKWRVAMKTRSKKELKDMLSSTVKETITKSFIKELKSVSIRKIKMTSVLTEEEKAMLDSFSIDVVVK